MRLLFDKTLSFRLVRELADLYPGSALVRDIGLRGAEYRQIWEYAAEHAFLLIAPRAPTSTRGVSSTAPRRK